MVGPTRLIVCEINRGIVILSERGHEFGTEVLFEKLKMLMERIGEAPQLEVSKMACWFH